jgi:ribonuclease P protein component
MDAKADVPTKKAQENAYTRFPGAHGHRRREESAQGTAAEGPAPTGRDTGMGQEAELEGKLATAAAQGLEVCYFLPSAMERRIRLRRSRDVQQVYDEGKSWTHPLLVLVARRNGLDHSRVGFTASRKLGGAVARNRAKRLLREAARHLYAELAAGWDVMLIARAGVLKAKEPQVEEALVSLLRRAGLSA